MAKMWEYFGKLAAVVAVLGTVVGIYVALRSDGADLIAECQYYDYELPPDLSKALSHTETSRDLSGRLVGAIPPALVPSDLVAGQGMIETMAKILEEARPGNLSEYSYEKFATFSVRNRGKRQATGVVLNLGTTGIAAVEKPGLEAKAVPANQPVELGDMRPGDAVKVAVWTRYSWFDKDEVSLTWRDGRGRVSFCVPMFGAMATLVEASEPILFVGGFLLVVVVLAVCATLLVLHLRGRLPPRSTHTHGVIAGQPQGDD